MERVGPALSFSLSPPHCPHFPPSAPLPLAVIMSLLSFMSYSLAGMEITPATAYTTLVGPRQRKGRRKITWCSLVLSRPPALTPAFVLSSRPGLHLPPALPNKHPAL